MTEHVENTSPLLVFVARVSSVRGSVQGELDRLQESLDYLEEEHRVNHDTRGWRAPRFFPFYHGANKPWRPDGRPMRFFVDLVTEAQCLRTPVMLVVTGWLGLTTNSFVFDELVSRFEDAGVELKLRIYAEEPRRFFDVNPKQARDALHNEYDRDVELEDSTWLFVEKFVAGNYVRGNFSLAALQNVETENRRNTHPDMVRSFNKHRCEICGEDFWFSAFLKLHMKRRHPPTEDGKKPGFKCPHCDATFTRQDSVPRHARKCKKNPDAEQKRPKPPAERGSVKKQKREKKQVATSDNGLKTYDQLSASDVLNLPRIDPNDPVVYRGEHYCRYPGCTDTNDFADNKVRRHYRLTHHVSLPNLPKSVGGEGLAQHKKCLSWLARCSQLGQEHVGEAPPKPSFW